MSDGHLNFEEHWRRRNPQPHPKVQIRQTVPASFAAFMREVTDLIEAGDASATIESDDLLQCEDTYGGLYDPPAGRYGFAHFRDTGLEETDEDGFHITWDFDLDKEQIRAIPEGRLTELPMWRCQNDCGRRFGVADAFCPHCDPHRNPKR